MIFSVYKRIVLAKPEWIGDVQRAHRYANRVSAVLRGAKASKGALS